MFIVLSCAVLCCLEFSHESLFSSLPCLLSLSVSLSLSFSVFSSRFFMTYTLLKLEVTGCDFEGGFGDWTVQCLHNAGFLVFAGCYAEEGVRRIEASNSDRIIGVRLDVTCDNSVRACLDEIRQQLDRKNAVLWGCVNNVMYCVMLSCRVLPSLILSILPCLVLSCRGVSCLVVCMAVSCVLSSVVFCCVTL